MIVYARANKEVLKKGARGGYASSLDGFVNPCRGIGGGHRKLLDGAGGKLATVATSPADSEESSLGVPEVAPPSSQHRNSITPPSVHAFVLRIPFPHAHTCISLFVSYRRKALTFSRINNA